MESNKDEKQASSEETAGQETEKTNSSPEEPVAGSNPLDRTVPGHNTNPPPESERDSSSDTEENPTHEDTTSGSPADQSEHDNNPSEAIDDTPDTKHTSPETVEQNEDESEQRSQAESSTENSDPENNLYQSLEEYRGLTLFSDIGPEAIQEIVNGGKKIQLQDGETLFEEGDSPGERFYIIVSGELKIMKFMRTRTTQVTILDQGNFLGEFGMFTGNDRMAGAESKGTTEILEVQHETLQELKDTHPEELATIYENMFGMMSKRFKALAEKAEKSQFWL